MTSTVVLCILDGWGQGENGPNNAIAQAKTPFWDDILKTSPHTLLEASEEHVGLPEGQMGNSEVGHMSIGAGRVSLRDLLRINQAIQKQELTHLPPLQELIQRLKASNGTCHLMGLLSPGGIHSHESHIKELAKIISQHGVPVAIHAFLDGRDTPPKSAEEYISSCQEYIKDNPLITLATIGGRYYGMDRDNRWDRIRKAYEVIVDAKPQTNNFLQYIQKQYAKGITDEFIPPIATENYQGLKDGDGLFMANFRADRVRQLFTALVDPDFDKFNKKSLPKLEYALGLTEYSDALSKWMKPLFPPDLPTEVLGQVIADHHLKQLRIAETEKYAHVTFFFNGGKEDTFPGEERILIPSPQVSTYDLKPEMSANELTDELVDAILGERFALIVANYANTDMVGHTGNFEATKTAVETVDSCLGRLQEATKKSGACLLITADHGNAEIMYNDKIHSPHTAHSLNPVPFVMINGPKQRKLHKGKLSDIAPTILAILKLPIPSVMTGTTLLESHHA